MVKNPPAMPKTQEQSLGREDPLEKEMTTHSSTLAWKIPRTEGPGGLQSMGSQRVGHDLATKPHDWSWGAYLFWTMFPLPPHPSSPMSLPSQHLQVCESPLCVT